MRDLEDFYSKVRPNAPGVAEPTMDEHILKAARVICRRTRCWRFTDTWPVTLTDQEIVAVPPYASMFELENAWFNNYELERSQPQEDHNYDAEGMPRYISQREYGSFVIQPRANGTLKISMFLEPAQGATMLPDVLYDRFADAVGNGALSTILMLPNQPYSSPDMAMYNKQLFDAVVDRDFNFQKRGQQRAPTRNRSSYF